MKSFILAMIISLGFLTISVAAIRRRKLRDQAAVMWIVVSLVLVLLSLALPFEIPQTASLTASASLTRPTFSFFSPSSSSCCSYSTCRCPWPR